MKHLRKETFAKDYENSTLIFLIQKNQTLDLRDPELTFPVVFESTHLPTEYKIFVSVALIHNLKDQFIIYIPL